MITSLDAVREDVREALRDLEYLLADRAPVRQSVVVDAMQHLWYLTGLFLYGPALERAAARLQRGSRDPHLTQEPIHRARPADLAYERIGVERRGLGVSTQTPYYAARDERPRQEPNPPHRDASAGRWRRIERISDLADP